MIDPCQPMPQDKPWLPEAAWKARHEELLALRQTNPNPRVIFLGDSITAGWSAEGNVDEQKRPLFMRFFGEYRPLNLGIGGDETQHVLWRLDHGEMVGLKPAVVVLLIGTNNIGNSQLTGSQTAPGVQKVVRTLRTQVPDARILHLAVFPRGRTADDLLRRQVGVLNEYLVKGYEAAPDRHVSWLDLSQDFLTPEGVLPEGLFPDALHLTSEAYRKWGELIAPTVAKLAE